MSFFVDLVVDAVASAVTGQGRRRPAVDLFAFLVGATLGALTGVLFYTRLLDQGTAGMVAWVLIPFCATFLVLTVLGRPDSVKGGLVATAVALATALPLALFDLLFGFWR